MLRVSFYCSAAVLHKAFGIMIVVEQENYQKQLTGCKKVKPG